MYNKKFTFLKVICIAFSFICLHTSAFAQVVNDSAYIRTFGGGLFEEASDLKETYDKGLVIAGTSSSFGQGNTSIYVVKTNPKGLHQWSKTYGGSYNDWGKSVENAVNDRGYLFVGYSNSFSSLHDYDGYVVRTDSAGNLLWQKTYGGGDWDVFYNSYPLPDSGFVFCGKSASNSYGNSDAWLVRIDKKGNLMWEKNYDKLGDETFSDVIVVGNSIFAVGKNSPVDMGGLSVTNNNGLIVKYDLSGNLIKEFTYSNNASQNFELTGVIETHSGDLLLSGFKNFLTGASNSATLVMTIDKNLTGIVAENLGGPSAIKTAIKAIENSKHEIITVGTVDGGLGGTALFPAQFNINGSSINWQTSPTFGGNGDEEGLSLIMMKNKYLAFVGSTSTSSLSAGGKDMYLVIMKKDSLCSDKYVNEVTFKDTLKLDHIGIKSIKEEIQLISVYPNPVLSTCTVELGAPFYQEEYEVELINSLGQKVWYLKNQGKNFSFNRSELPSGLYLMQINSKFNKNLVKILLE